MSMFMYACISMTRTECVAQRSRSSVYLYIQRTLNATPRLYERELYFTAIPPVQVFHCDAMHSKPIVLFCTIDAEDELNFILHRSKHIPTLQFYSVYRNIYSKKNQLFYYFFLLLHNTLSFCDARLSAVRDGRSHSHRCDATTLMHRQQSK